VERGPASADPSGSPSTGGGALHRRLAVAAVGLPALGALLALAEEPFLAALLLLAGFAGAEVARAAGASIGSALRAGVAVAVLAGGLRAADPVASAAMLPLVVLALAAVLSGARSERPAWLWWAAGMLYVAVLAAHLALLRAEPEGQRWLLVLLAGVFATDTGAYAVGRTLGRHALAPSISPRKTWEGAAGGFLGGAAATAGAAWALDLTSGADAITGGALLAAALALPIAAQVGDLLASAIKRRLDVKDFSRLLPGHGGLLDRMDSLLAAGPTLYWMVAWGT
jgi:phosphatidate cytidylyltransferase